ncbi:hypothetical protein GCM10028775_21360 [Catellatospora paridis]
MFQIAEASRDAFTAGRDLHLTFGSPGILPQHASNLRVRPIFIQYLNPEVLACYGIGRAEPSVLPRALHATRLAVLATEGHLILPASYLFEVPCMPRFLSNVSALIEARVLRYSSHLSDLNEYVQHKASEYRADSINPYTGRFAKGSLARIAWQPRYAADTASDIAREWDSALTQGLLTPLLTSITAREPSRALQSERSLREVPNRLAGQAFIGRFVRDSLPFRINPHERTKIDHFLSRAYLCSYLSDLDANLLSEFSFGQLTCGVERTTEEFAGRVLSAHLIDLTLKWLRIYEYIHKVASWPELLLLRDTPEFALVMTKAFGASSELRIAAVRANQRRRQERATTFQDVLASVEGVATELARF